MPDWLVWLLPVPAATLAAVAWTAWAGRPRRPVKAVDSVLAYERFRQALATPVPARRVQPPGQDPSVAAPRVDGRARTRVPAYQRVRPRP